MIKVGTLAKIRRLYFRDKLSIKEICRQTSLSRNTVRAWLRDSEMQEPKYPPRRIVTKLDDYADTLNRWDQRFQAAWDDIRKMGGFDERFRRLWRFYLGYCEAGFRSRRTDVIQLALTRI